MKAVFFIIIAVLLFDKHGDTATIQTMPQDPYYNIKLNVFPDEKYLTAEGTLVFNIKDFPGDSIKFLLNETMADLKMNLIETDGSIIPQTKKKEESQNGQIQYSFSTPVNSGSHSQVKVSFSFNGGRQSAFEFYLGSDGSFAAGVAAAWYPQLLVPLSNGSYNVAYAIGQLGISVPHKYTPVVAGGTLVSQYEDSLNTRIYNVDKPGYFTFYVGKYTLTSYNGGPIPVEAYTLDNKEYINSYLEGSSKIVDFLTSAFGPYPYDKFIIVEIPDEESQKQGIGGASVPGGIMMPSGSLEAKFNLALYGHEISHQWWGNHITRTGDAGTGMLDEALAQFGALIVVEKFDNNNGAEKFRRTGYPGYIFSQSGFGYLKNTAAGIDKPLSQLTPALTHTLGDSKGFLVYDILSQQVGRERFFNALKNITAKYARITWEQFLQEVQDASGQDLQWFYDQWFNRTGAPEWNYDFVQNGDTLQINVTQTEPFYRIDTLEITIAGNDGSGSSTRNVSIAGKESIIKIPVDFSVNSVTLDPHFKVLNWQPSYKEEVYQLAPIAKLTDLRVADKLSEAETLYDSLKNNIPSPDRYGFYSLLQYEIARIMFAQEKYQEAMEHFRNSVSAPSFNNNILPWIYYRMAQTAQKLGDNETLRWAVQSAVDTDEANGERTIVSTLALKLLK